MCSVLGESVGLCYVYYNVCLVQITIANSYITPQLFQNYAVVCMFVCSCANRKIFPRNQIILSVTTVYILALYTMSW